MVLPAPLTLDTDEPLIPPAEFARRMAELAALDTAEAHAAMDDLLCRVLVALGYGDGVAIYAERSETFTE